MTTGRDIVVEELRAAGYTEVKRAPKGGEFRLTKDGLIIARAQQESVVGPLSYARFEIEVDQEKIHRISPSGRVVLGFAQLAGFRGPEMKVDR